MSSKNLLIIGKRGKKMTYEDCITKNHDTGNQYIALAKDTRSLVENFKIRQKESKNNDEWDFPHLISLYTKLAERFEEIGKRLIAI